MLCGTQRPELQGNSTLYPPRHIITFKYKAYKPISVASMNSNMHPCNAGRQFLYPPIPITNDSLCPLQA